METKKRALGRGLEQLFNNENLGLDIESSSRRNCANVLIWEWFDNNIQKEFNLQYIEADGCYIITNVNSGKVLDAENGGTTNYTNVWQYEYNGSAAQKWFIIKDANGNDEITITSNDLILTAKNRKTNGKIIIQKQDSSTKKNLQGIGFKIYSKEKQGWLMMKIRLRIM